MNTNTISKINTLGKVGYIISKIAKILALVGASVCLVAGIICCLIPSDAFTLTLESTNTATVTLNGESDLFSMIDLGEGDVFIEIDGNKYTLGGADAPENVTFKYAFNIVNIRLMCFTAMVSCVLLFIPMLFAERVCKIFKECTTPFTETASKSLTALAWSLVPVAFLSFTADSVADSIFSGGLNLSISIDLTTALLILCIFMLSFVFKYGTALQAEADETL